MGNVIERHCPKCTYKKVFQEGVGMNGCNLYFVRRCFDEKEAAEFYLGLEQKKVRRFILGQETGFCERCHDYMTEAVLSYTLQDGSKKQIRANCPVCKGILSHNSEELCCPKCGALLEERKVGLWD